VTITDVWWDPPAPGPGDRVRFNARVVNQGAATTPAGVTVGVRSMVDGQPITTDPPDQDWGARLEMAAGEADPPMKPRSRFAVPGG
jgi:hypothetical protein